MLLKSLIYKNALGGINIGMFVDYQFPSDISFSACFCKIWETVLMFNWLILKGTHKSDFDIDHVVTIFNFPQKLTENQYPCEGS